MKSPLIATLLLTAVSAAWAQQAPSPQPVQPQPTPCMSAPTQNSKPTSTLGKWKQKLDDKSTEFGNRIGVPLISHDEYGLPNWAAYSTPYGAQTQTVATGTYTGPVTQNLRLPGQYFDHETTFHYNGFRDYMPGIGRYLESDPIGLGGGMNTYAYAGANPFLFVDSSGLASGNPYDNIVDNMIGVAGNCVSGPCARPMNPDMRNSLAFNSDFAAQAFGLASGFSMYGGAEPLALAFYGLSACSKAISQLSKPNNVEFTTDSAAEVLMEQNGSTGAIAGSNRACNS